MNVLPELWAHMARLMAQRTARLLATAATLLVLAACGPGTGGTGTGPINGVLGFSGSGFAVGAPCAQHCGSTELRLENERVELTVTCRHFVFTGPWEIDATGLAVLNGTLETTELADGQVQTRTVAAEMRLQFSDTRADSSREVAVTVRDAQGNHLIAPLTLEQRPAATAPEACAPGTP
ncbi:hypothetical protein [Acidovorax kalamii]|nr:hypothetical protein [Acidovorax kalamii]